MTANETVRGVLASIEENRRRFEEFCHSLSEEQLNRPVPESTWVVRDFAAHLGTLDTVMLDWFRATQDAPADSTATVDPTPGLDIDAFNDAEVAERRAWPLERVFAEAAANRAQLVKALESLTDDQVARTMHFSGDNKRGAGDIPLRSFLIGWAQHDPIHVADMLRALPELSDDAVLRAWLDSPFVRAYQAVMNRG